MGFVAAAGQPASHRVVELAVGALARLAHRGGLDADGRSGDGAGILIQIPTPLFGERTAVAVLFSWEEGAREALERALADEGLWVSCWRRPPLDPDSLGAKARERMPEILHALIPHPDGMDAEDFDLRLYRARRQCEDRAELEGPELYLASCSSRIMIFKGLMAGTALADFYLDLADPRTESRLAVFHQRYSTNTVPDWQLAQPLRMLAHNGEINTISGNRNWMRGRDNELAPELRSAVWTLGSDSSSLDNVIELLCRQGADLAEAIMTVVPEAWEDRDDVAPQVRDFHRFTSTRFEPWDGPAALSFSDGRWAGAALDRNGLRPLRYQIAKDGLVVAASEAGVVPIPPADVLERGRLGPGQLLLVDVESGVILRDAEAKLAVARKLDFGRLADLALVPLGHDGTRIAVPETLTRRQRAFGWSAEDVRAVLQVMAETGAEPTLSMGDDTPIAPLGRVPRRLYGHLRQRFAQVTNPAIDSLRERSVMSLRTLIGAHGRTLSPEVATAVGERRTALFEVASPLLGAGELETVARAGRVLDATCRPGETLRGGLERLCREALAADTSILLVSDEAAGPERLPIPMVLAVGAVHECLLEAGFRLQRDVVAVAGDALDVHDLACLITVGATAVHPHLALATARTFQDQVPDGEDAEESYRHAMEYGLLKVMAKMGISCVSSYCGAQIVEVLGLGAEVMALCLPGIPSRVGGADLTDLDRRLRAWGEHAWEVEEPSLKNPLVDVGRFRFRKNGEFHANNPVAVRTGQKAAQSGDWADYQRWIELSTMEQPQDLRDLLRIQEAESPAPLDEVEAASQLRRRFVSTAMSLGAISPATHETLAVAMNEMGARSNSGEGGEDPALYGKVRGPRRDNRVKQVASARFGVTPEYLRQADELEIKIAQGSKPGEGGQLPGVKVTELIAQLRHAQPGQQLISPPPHHDIYSIEDLAELIHDLRAANPRARIGVKLVAEAGVGTIAAGVAKAKADYILISGHNGGTGASPLSSIKNAAIPWELGLAEAQQALMRHGTRERVTLRTDGGLRSGRDVVVAALLGAEEFGFGTGVLMALGCDMARQCHLNTCPAGIATQREDLWVKFTGRAEHVITYLTLIAEDVRRHLARLGVRTLDEIVGRVELLAAVPGDTGLDLSELLGVPEHPGAPRRRTWPRNGTAPTDVELPSGPIDNSHRAIGAARRDLHRSYLGAAGQSFGAWLDEGSELELEGEANDYVGKGMGGGRIVIRAPEKDGADRLDQTPVLAGNTCLYGATGGTLLLAGRAGERFAVRNSGAVAVVEGAGDHFCEYMTGGVVVSLGKVGRNVGAGMTGGSAYVLEWVQLNDESVAVRPVPDDAAPVLHGLVREHAARTGSRRAHALLADWTRALTRFRQVVPVSELAREIEAAGVA